MNILHTLKKPATIIVILAVVVSVILAVLSYRLTTQGPIVIVNATPTPKRVPTLTPTPTKASTATPLPTATPIVLPVQDPTNILGVEGSPDTDYAGIPWVRLGHPSCGWGNLQGQTLRDTLQMYHSKGVRVLLTICQSNGGNLYDTNLFNDAAQGRPDAVQCGNEQMKRDASVSFLYTPPDKFAKFYDLCEHAIHAVRSDVPIILGSLDPHVAGNDYQLMLDQANYLDQMQNAMNSSVHPGANWDWHNQTLGVIDSWHNGYLGSNNLAGVLDFWAQQFHTSRNAGDLGKHLWVVEGTACFKGCGIDANSAYQVALSHVVTLITDVQTSMQAHVPFFFFSGKDFQDQNINWPIGILDLGGHPKPIRQDLAMGVRTLTLTCPGGSATVSDQLQLLVKLYNRCVVPTNYAIILS